LVYGSTPHWGEGPKVAERRDDTVDHRFAFDRLRLLCFDIGSLDRMRFWGCKNLKHFGALMRITFEGEAAGVRCET
jgi:hypothetical protein